MTTKILKSVRGRRMRLTRLDATGTRIAGACSSIVTSGFIQVTIGSELEAGEEYTQKNAYGELCISEKEGDTIKWANIGIQMCEVNPDVMDVVAGANPVYAPPTLIATVNNKALTSNIATLTTAAPHLMSVGQTITVTGVDATFNGTYVILTTPLSTTLTYTKVATNVTSAAATGTVTALGTTIGATFGAAPNPEGFALELWTRNVSTGIASPIEWGYFLVPWVKNGQLDGDVTVENATLAMSMKGEGYAATAAWGINPYLDNPLLMTGGFPVGDLWGVVTTTVQPPAVTAGCVALA